MLWILLILAVGMVAVAVVVLVRTLKLPSLQVKAGPQPEVAIDVEMVAARLAEAVRFRTVSHQDPALIDAAAFNALRQFLQQAFPRVHGALKQEVVSEHSLLYTWEGRDKGLKPNAGLTDSIYRFSPVRVGPGDLDRIHGTDERISVAD